MMRAFLFLPALGGLAVADPVPAVAELKAWADAPDAASPPLRTGLAFVTESSGFLLTAYDNLTDPADGSLLTGLELRLRDDPERQVEVGIVGVEPTIGIAILKLETDAEVRSSKLVRERSVREADAIAGFLGGQAGDWPRAAGEVIALNTRECYQESLSSTMFRANLPLGGSSVGGPVFDPESGGVVAIYTGFQPQAAEGHVPDEDEIHLLPIALCLNIYESIKQKKSLKSPWTGFSVRALSGEEESLFPIERGHKGGVSIEHVWPDSPAERMGIREGDLLIQFSHNRIESVADFQKWLYMYGVGHPVKLVVLREGEDLLVCDYTIEERPESAKPR